MFESYSIFTCHAASRRARSWCRPIQPPNTSTPSICQAVSLYDGGGEKSVLLISFYLPKIPDNQERGLQLSTEFQFLLCKSCYKAHPRQLRRPASRTALG